MHIQTLVGITIYLCAIPTLRIYMRNCSEVIPWELIVPVFAWKQPYMYSESIQVPKVLQRSVHVTMAVSQ